MATIGKFDELSTRMKSYYENRTRTYLPRRTYTIIRIDGKSFHQYCKNLVKPFDDGFINDMDETACYLCKNIQGAKFAFVQSDEISILLTDFDKIGTDAWFDGNIQKMTSVAASMATAKFNQLRLLRYTQSRLKDDSINRISIETPYQQDNWLEELSNIKLAEFDARVFTIPSKTEVVNMMVWRQKDAVRNSISSVAQSLYSHKELEGKDSDQKQEMIFQKGVNWNNYAPLLKRGRFITKEMVTMETPFVSVDKKQTTYERSVWKSVECPIFTQDREFLQNKIPEML